MSILKRLVDFYIQSSIHVALSCAALVLMTNFMFGISGNEAVSKFAFFGTIVGYNFVKYDALARVRKLRSLQLKSIVIVSVISFFATAYFFFQLQKITQLVSVVVLGLTLLYTLPFFPNKKNARNWAGIKIYIVAFCWVGVTVVLPVLNAEIVITSDFNLKCIQRFILIFVLILIFEIIDLKKDDPHLQTVPQQIGVAKTKKLGVLLLLLFYVLEFFKINFQCIQLFVNAIIVVIILLFLAFADERKSKYYTSFWVESIPIFWWLLFVSARVFNN